MILPALVALPVAVGPLLRGSLDPGSQALLHLTTAAGLTAWLAYRLLIGYLPLPSRRNLLWTASLLGLGALSSWTSPLHALALPQWHNFLNAAWMFPAMAALSKDERAGIDEAVRASAWVLMILAFYQRWHYGESSPASALVDPQVYAGTTLMLLPLALERKDRLLALGLLWTMLWSASAGAWLGLFGAVLLTPNLRRTLLGWVAGAGGLFCLVALYNKFQSPEVLGRWQWWRCAAEMALRRPWTGYGPGAFGHVQPAWVAGGPASSYAHQYFLQTMAEYGVPFAVLWFAGLWHCLRRSSSHKRFAALAALIHSLWYWTLSMPSNLWLFSYFTASSIRDSSRGVNIPSRLRLPLVLAVLACGTLLGRREVDLWEASRAKTSGLERLRAADLAAGRQGIEKALRLAPRDPETHAAAAELELREAAASDSSKEAASHLDRAAQALERSAALDPYRTPTWTQLSIVYRRLGRPDLAALALERSTRVLRHSP